MNVYKKIKIRMETCKRFIPSLSYITNELRGGEEIGKSHLPTPSLSHRS